MRTLPLSSRLVVPSTPVRAPAPARRAVSYDRDALLAPAAALAQVRSPGPTLAAGALGFDAHAADSVAVSGSATPNTPFKAGQSVQSTIHLDGDGTLQSLSLALNLSHRDRNGVSITLTSPSGKTVQVPIPTDHTMNGTVDLSAALAGEKVAGDWTLTVTDAMKRDEGTLASWSLSGQATPPADPGKISLYPMPDSGAAPILDAIDNATQSIDLSCYLITDRNVFNALEAAAKRGVKVRVMMEPHLVSPGGTETFDQKVAELTAAGAQAEATPPDYDSKGNVDHAKFMIIDGKNLLLGTGNLTKSGLGNGSSTANRDIWLSDTRSESVQEAETVFTADWNRQPTDTDRFSNLVVTPDGAQDRLLALIDSAKTRLYVDNQELESSAIVQALIAAKQRGVDVEVLCAAPTSKTAKDKNAPAVQALQAAGVKALEVSSLYLHAKAIISDDQAFIGSQNFSTDGLLRNREIGDIFGQKDVVDQLVTLFQTDFQNGIVWASEHGAKVG